ncbi:MAG: hypothetical protein IPN50_12280 [Sphingomonadales bacterium]|nr:hypothetical protein [Sphingomonadales bacterium]
MRIGQIGCWGLAFAGFAFANSAAAEVLPGSCQEIINLQDDSEVDTARLIEVDGATITTPVQFVTQLAGAKGKLLIIKGGDFSGWDFAPLSKSFGPMCFNQSNLKSTRWDGGKYDGIGFIESELENASFRDASLQSILLRVPYLKSVDMTGADLSDGWFDGGWDGSIENWKADKARLVNFTFSCGITLGDGCPLDRQNVSFIGADFSGANISSYRLWGQGNYSAAIFDGTRFEPAQMLDLINAEFRNNNFLVGGGEEVELNADEINQIILDATEVRKTNDRPSFDCAKARSIAEKEICGEYASDVRALDRRMASLYATIRPKYPAIASSQKTWIANRNSCADRACLLSAYQKRVSQLMVSIGEPEVISPGTSALFINDTLELSDAFRSSGLFRKITPVLVGASSAEALLTRERDGRYSIAGEAVGANAHLCSVDGQGLRFDPRTGWFAGPSENGPMRRAAVFRSFDDRIEFPGDGHADDTEFPGSGDYVSCGARAVLPELRQIDVDAALLDQRAKAYSEGD